MGCLTSSRLTWIASRLVTRTSYEDSSQRRGGSARGVRRIAPISCGMTAIKPDGRLVAHTGFEPVVSALRGQCPRPLDECAPSAGRARMQMIPIGA